MPIIAIAGYATSGKDTAADHLVAEYGYTKFGWADRLREFMLALNPIVGYETKREPGYVLDGPLDHNTVVRYVDLIMRVGYHDAKFHPKFGAEVRALLQRLGTDAGRDILGQNVWVDALMSSLPSGNIVIPDTRFHNEAMAARDNEGLVIRIHRPGVGPLNDHPSETSLDTFAFDVVVVNDGTVADLQRKIDRVVLDFDMWAGDRL